MNKVNISKHLIIIGTKLEKSLKPSKQFNPSIGLCEEYYSRNILLNMNLYGGKAYGNRRVTNN